MNSTRELLVKLVVDATKANKNMEEFNSSLSKVGKTASSSSKDADKFGKAAESAGKESRANAPEVDKLGTAAEKTGKKAAKSSEEIDELNKSTANAGKESRNATGDVSSLKDGFDSMLKPLSDVKSSLDKVKGLLGMFGVSVGIGELINQLKELAEQADAARRAVQGAEQNIYYTTGDLTDDQKKMYAEILSYNKSTGQMGYAGADAEKNVSTAIAMLYQANPTASYEQIMSLANEQLSLDLMGKGELASNIKASDAMFKEWGVSVEEQAYTLSFLRTVSQETGVDFAELLSKMKELKGVSDDLGLSFADTARMIGSFGFDTSKLDSLSKDIETAWSNEGMTEEILKSAFSEYIERAISSTAASGNIIGSYQQSISGRKSADYDIVQQNYALLEKQNEFWARFNERSSERLAEYMSMGYSGNEAFMLTKATDLQSFALELIDSSGLREINTDYFDSMRDEYGLIDGTLRDGYGILDKNLQVSDNIYGEVQSISKNIGNTPTTVIQNFYVPAADSYVVKNAAQQGINASQSRGMKLV